jgi:hemoglobin
VFQPNARPLFDKLGSTKSIEAVVDEFYKRVLVDTELKHFFAKTNMTWLRMRQVQFFTKLWADQRSISERA